jgi:hypothetical protein
MGLFDASSRSSSSDSRQAATDNARNIRGGKYQEAGSVDFTHARISQGNVTLTGINGPVTLGDNGSGIAQISQIFADTVAQISSQGNATLRDLLFGSSAASDPSQSALGSLGSLLSGTGAADSSQATAAATGPTDPGWWTTQRKIVAAAVGGLLLFFLLKR